MEKLLGKRKLYNRVKDIMGNTIPAIHELKYSEYKGTEWLEDRDFNVTSNAGGDWLGIHHVLEDKKGKEHSQYEVFSSYHEGTYQRHYRNGELL